MPLNCSSSASHTDPRHTWQQERFVWAVHEFKLILSGCFTREFSIANGALKRGPFGSNGPRKVSFFTRHAAELICALPYPVSDHRLTALSPRKYSIESVEKAADPVQVVLSIHAINAPGTRAVPVDAERRNTTHDV